MKKFGRATLLLGGALISLSALAQTPAGTVSHAVPPALPAPMMTSKPAVAPAPNAVPAAPSSTDGSQQPIDITADKTLEWHRNDLQYIARGNVVAKQGDATLYCDTLVADYRPDPDKSNGTGQIYRLTAEGNVRLTSQDNTVVGDHGIYNVDTSVGVLTGTHLKGTTPTETVTARDRMTYNSDTGEMTGEGAAHDIHLTDKGTVDTIDSDTLFAWFEQAQGANGQPPAPKPTAANAANPMQQQGRQLSRLAAEGHVVIHTPTDVLHGDHSNYDAHTQIATTTGKLVRIDRGPNILTGTRAETNMDTNISVMSTTPGSGMPVHAIFYPSSKNGGAAASNTATDKGKPGKKHPSETAANTVDLPDAPPVPPMVIGAP